MGHTYQAVFSETDKVLSNLEWYVWSRNAETAPTKLVNHEINMSEDEVRVIYKRAKQKATVSLYEAFGDYKIFNGERYETTNLQDTFAITPKIASKLLSSNKKRGLLLGRNLGEATEIGSTKLTNLERFVWLRKAEGLPIHLVAYEAELSIEATKKTITAARKKAIRAFEQVYGHPTTPVSNNLNTRQRGRGPTK